MKILECANSVTTGDIYILQYGSPRIRIFVMIITKL